MTRFFDLFFAIVALVLLAPFLLPVIVILRFTGEGEVFYVQRRVGLGETCFGLVKFATMLKDSPRMGTGTITVKNDPRVLPVGALLRKTKINELPQLWNIIMGDMSLIGPRPLTPDAFAMYPGHMKTKISSVRPGLSGIGSIVFRDEESLMTRQKDPTEFYRSTIAPYKAELELWFVENRSIWLYFKCIAITAWVVLNPSSTTAFSVFKSMPKPPSEVRRNSRNS